MKTPKRTRAFVSQFVTSQACKNVRARYKRKNRISQYKRTIARLTAESERFREFQLGGHLKIYSPEWEAFMVLSRLKTPAEGATPEEKLDHWLNLRKVTELALDAACFAAKAFGIADEKEYAACHPKTAESGQQTDLPSTGGQQDCIAQTAENATQNNLLCTDAEQLETRKGN